MQAIHCTIIHTLFFPQSTLLLDLMPGGGGLDQVGGTFMQASLDSIWQQQDFRFL